MLGAALASVLVGNAAFIAFIALAGAAGGVGRVSWARRLALTLAVLLAGAIPASVAHRVIYDRQPLGLIYQPTREVIEGLACLLVAVWAVLLANKRRPTTS